MASGLLSLKWNNHKSTFFHVLSSIRSKESYCDATLACDGRFYPVHRLVLSTCSEYFEQIFQRTQCKHPVIVLKDIRFDDLEALLNYMYVGEVNVLQDKLSSLIKAAECLKIKGLAVPDEEPIFNRESRKSIIRSDIESPRAKRRRKDSDLLTASRLDKELALENHDSLLDRVTTPVNSKEENILKNDSSYSKSFRENNEDDLDSLRNSSKRKSEASIDETSVKTEPPDIVIENELDSKEEFTYNPPEENSANEADNRDNGQDDNDSDYSNSIVDSGPQSVEDVVSQAMPSSSSFQGNAYSMWEGEGSSQNFPSGDGTFNTENSQGRSLMPTSWNSNSASGRNMDSERVVGGAVYLATTRRDSSNSVGSTRSLDSSPMSPPIGRIHKCHTCLKVFPSHGGLEAHVRIHTGEKPFACNVCSYRTTQRGNLNTHKRIHTGERPFPCKICNLSFVNSSNLKAHNLAKHEHLFLNNVL